MELTVVFTFSRPGWVAALHETFGECGFEAIEVDQRTMGDSDLVSWHDNAFFSLENFGLSADDGGEMERLLDEAGKESTDNRRGVAITGDSVTVIGRWPGPGDRKSTRLNSSHSGESRMPSSA